MSSPEDIVLAEEIGYERAWLYDTPQQSPDVWITLALAAGRTSRISARICQAKLSIIRALFMCPQKSPRVATIR